MNVQLLEAAILFLEVKGPNHYKISLRSKGKINVSAIADKLGGGGHFHSSGAFVKGSLNVFKTQIIDSLKEQSSNLKNTSIN